MLRFSDGITVDTSCELKILSLKDGLYVCGKGHLIPVNSMEEAVAVLEELESVYE